MKKSIFNYTLDKLGLFLEENGFKKYSAKQIFNWLYVKNVLDFEQMTNLSKDLKVFLSNNFIINHLNMLVSEESHDGTIKLLFMLDDKRTIETVLMSQKYGQSVCVTTQVGCKMACKFCASGLIKTERNLEIHEMVLQILTINNILREKYKDDPDNPRSRVSHIVVMGIGEPFDNFDNVWDFVNIVNNDHSFNIGARHITISTCGVVPKIIEFANLNSQVNLAISLHAPNNEIRNKLMPINKAYPIEKLFEAVKYYINKTNRRITFEYILIEDINDSEENARELAKLIKGINGYVNLIPYNEVEENPFKRSTKISQFFSVLRKLNVNAILRKEFGNDINAACGQLRAKREGIIKNEI
ncbi:23S rRNA (adenine2503-C2)-methyltransferase N [Spiroplasma corruscae]|uniref:Probable dual-specificity RNA methyltransferase RlmN n=1 Tax=Spiroplasma corruscae TaxID=216934 RepID=A0A222EN75_9MOLU|nr:23S rRNA (adenine(2503)-C(2))-methyltransferase RlmN [Spiroplasma corruscae]ASP27950.1 23S rRNA (adenine2503-C2)-methyltransferase N [Spiroplasma corruscae]